MPRNASGNYTLPLPSVVTGTVIESLWANTTMNDLAASVTDSLDRYGRGGMVAPFRMVDGTVSTPAISFSSETNTGLYKASAGVVSLAVLGAEVQTWTSAATTLGIDLNLLGDFNVLGNFEIDGDILLADDKAVGWGANNTRIAGNDTTDTITFFTNALERMRIAANGNVGIARASPLQRLHIGAGTGSTAEIAVIDGGTSGAAGGASFAVHNGGTYVLAVGNRSALIGGGYDAHGMILAAGDLVSGAGGVERMRILSTGQVRINSNSNIGQFDVEASGAGIIAKSASEAGSVAHLGVYNLNANGLQWYIAMNANDTDIHNPRGNLKHFLGGVEKFRIQPSEVTSYVPLSSRVGNHSVSIFGQAAPLIQFFYEAIADWRIQVHPDASMRWDYGGGLSRMLLNSSGCLIVGTNALAQGYQNISNQTLEGATGYGVFNHVAGTGNGTFLIAFGYAGGSLGSITQATTGSVAYNTTSDSRLKENLIDLPDVGAIIDALRPRRFSFINDPEHTLLSGLVAQEAVAVLPEIVSYTADFDQWGIDYGKLTPILLREIQSLRARVAALGG